MFHSTAHGRQPFDLLCTGDKYGSGQTFQVRPRAESTPLASHDTDTQRGFLVKPLPYLVELSVPGGVDTIEFLGPRKSYEQNMGRREGDLAERRRGRWGGECWG